jgi:hypothetical protein
MGASVTSNHGLVRVCEPIFYVKITPRQKLGNAVARSSVAPVRLHRLIRHKGINTRRIIARGGGSGGGGLITLLAFRLLWRSSPKTPRFRDFFLKRGKTPKKNIFEGDSKTTNPVVAKSYEKQKITSSWFYHCHPYVCCYVLIHT